MSEKIYGRRAVFEAIKSGRRKITKIMIARGGLKGSLFREIVDEAGRHGIPVEEHDRKRIDGAAGTEHHQGVLAVASAIVDEGLSSLLARAYLQKEDPFLLVVENVTDPQNLGAIFRTAEAAGVHGIILPERKSAPIDRATAKASAGAVEHLAVCHVSNLSQAIMRLKDEAIRVFAADVDRSATKMYDAPLGGPVAIVVGSEEKGVSRSVKDRCHGCITIPMRGRIGSLNVSAATAVILFEVLRRRR